MIRAALAYARAGWPVLPLEGKIPRCQHGVHDATCEPDQVRAWWRRWPTANIGLAMGMGGRLALDVDGHAGAESLVDLQHRHGQLPRTLTQATPSGGLHHIFRAQADAKIGNRVKFAAGLDVRSAGGYIAVAPSVGANGRRYRWIDRSPITPAPAWLVDMIRVREPVPSKAPPVWITDGDVQQRLRRASAYLAKMPPSVSGSGGHMALWRATIVLARGFLLPDDAVHALLVNEFSPRCQPPWSEKEIAHKVRQVQRSRVPVGYLLADDDRRGAAA